MSSLLVERKNDVVHVTLNRPEMRNAFDDALIAEITAAFGDVGDARAVVLGGAGEVFCAGGDLGWMQRAIDYTEEQNLEDARKLGAMFAAVNSCPAPVIAKVQGAAYGGGLGLVCVCDIVICADGTKLCFSETKLGLSPAVIAPYALAKMGEAWARRYFLTAEVLSAEDALKMGLVHEIVPRGELDAKCEDLVEALRAVGPLAVRAAKRLLGELRNMSGDAADEVCARTIAGLRVSPEGQEGVRAFLEKRAPDWRL